MYVIYDTIYQLHITYHIPHVTYWNHMHICYNIQTNTVKRKHTNTLYIHTYMQERLNSLKVVGAQLTNKTHFYCEKLNSYEHLQILWGQVPPVPPWFCRLCIYDTHATAYDKMFHCKSYQGARGPTASSNSMLHICVYMHTYLFHHEGNQFQIQHLTTSCFPWRSHHWPHPQGEL